MTIITLPKVVQESTDVSAFLKKKKKKEKKKRKKERKKAGCIIWKLFHFT